MISTRERAVESHVSKSARPGAPIFFASAAKPKTRSWATIRFDRKSLYRGEVALDFGYLPSRVIMPTSWEDKESHEDLPPDLFQCIAINRSGAVQLIRCRPSQ